MLDLDSTKDLHPPLHDNPLSGSTTFSSNPLLEEFADELAFPLKYDDDLQLDIESDLKEIEFLLYQDVDSSLKDSIDQSNLANLADIFIDSMTEMFTDEHALDYSSPPIFDEYDDDFLEVESDAENLYDDPFDSKGEKIKECKLLIDELDLPCDFLPSDIPGNVKTNAEGFCPPVFISSASLGNHKMKTNNPSPSVEKGIYTPLESMAGWAIELGRAWILLGLSPYLDNIRLSSKPVYPIYPITITLLSLTDNTIRVNRIVTIFLIKSSIHIPGPKFNIQDFHLHCEYFRITQMFWQDLKENA
nr:hypothetical protein [Tanacetum cinerariifolium]